MRSIIFFSLSVFFVISNSQLVCAELPQSYDSMIAKDKQSTLWKEMVKTPYTVLPTEDPGFFSGLLRLFQSTFLTVSFTHSSDEMPANRLKLIHTYGSVAQVELIMNVPASQYTGIFGTGGIGFARLSLAKQAGSFTPGMGLKILVDHQPSVNFQVMYSLEGQESDRNFFRNKFSNIINPPNSFVLRKLGGAFESAVQSLSTNPSEKPENAVTLPLFEAAAITSEGLRMTPETIIEPYEVVFIPTPAITKNYEAFLSKTSNLKKVDQDYRLGLGMIPEGTVLYTVSVKGKRGSTATEEIGRLVSRSPFIASEYGDSKLFFQHQRHRNSNIK